MRSTTIVNWVHMVLTAVAHNTTQRLGMKEDWICKDSILSHRVLCFSLYIEISFTITDAWCCLFKRPVPFWDHSEFTTPICPYIVHSVSLSSFLFCSIFYPYSWVNEPFWEWFGNIVIKPTDYRTSPEGAVKVCFFAYYDRRMNIIIDGAPA